MVVQSQLSWLLVSEMCSKYYTLHSRGYSTKAADTTVQSKCTVSGSHTFQGPLFLLFYVFFCFWFIFKKSADQVATTFNVRCTLTGALFHGTVSSLACLPVQCSSSSTEHVHGQTPRVKDSRCTLPQTKEANPHHQHHRNTDCGTGGAQATAQLN